MISIVLESRTATLPVRVGIGIVAVLMLLNDYVDRKCDVACKHK